MKTAYKILQAALNELEGEFIACKCLLEKEDLNQRTQLSFQKLEKEEIKTSY